MHGPFCHKMWSVLSLTRSVLSCGGPFCPWSVLSMVRYVPNSFRIVVLCQGVIGGNYGYILLIFIKTFVVTLHLNHLDKVNQMRGLNIDFKGEKNDPIIVIKYFLLPYSFGCKTGSPFSRMIMNN